MSYAFDTSMAAKIYDKLFLAVIQKERVAVYTVDKAYFEVIEQAPDLYLVEGPEQADIALVNHKEDLPSTTYPLIFTTDIRIYEEHLSTIGIFYWDHGRPKIIFSKERLRAFNITLHEQWSKYVKSDGEL